MVDPVSIAIEASALATVVEGGGVGLGGLTTLGAISSIGVPILAGGAAVGGALLLNSLAPKQHADNQITVKQATPPRQRVYGRALLAGSYFFFAATGTHLLSGFILCEGPIDGFEEHWFNGQISPDGPLLSGKADMWPWYSQVYYAAYVGTADQVANGAIQAYFGSWDASHRCQGLALTVTTCITPPNPSKNFTKYCPSGAPTYLARVRGLRVFDPRDATQRQGDPTTWKWSANPALCIMDYLASPRGMGIPASRINLTAFAAMADVCDQPVPLGALGQADDQVGNGISTETRYVLWGTYQLDEEPKAVLERMLKTCDGELYPIADGTIGLRGGAWSDPTFTITDDMITSIDARRGVDKLAKFNQLRIRTLSIYNQFQIVEGDPWDDVRSQLASGEVLPQDFELPMVPNYTQGCRLAKIAMAKGNPAWIVTVTGPLVLLQALGERVVQLVNADFAINEPMFITGYEIVSEAECKISMGSLSAAAYAWSTAEERNAAPASGMASNLAPVPPAVVGLKVAIGRTAINDTTTAAQINLSITPPSDTTLVMIAEYQAQGDATWTEMTVDEGAYTAVSGILADRTTYSVRAAFTIGGAIGPYSTASIVAVSDPNAPDPVTNFAASTQANTVTLSWQDSNSGNFYGTNIYRAQSGSGASTLITTVYGGPGAAGSATDKPGLGSWSYTAKSINESGVESSPAGPVTAATS